MIRAEDDFMPSPPTPPSKIRLAVLLSGTGRTLENLLKESARGALAAEVAVVVSDRDDARGLTIAAEKGIEAHVVRPKDYGFTEEFSKAVTYKIEPHGIDLVVMAGFLSLYKIPRKYERRVMNIHPALIPAFSGEGYFGQRVHEAVIARGCRVTGCTVHFANNQYDAGPIILQEVVPVLDGDTADTLAARVFEKECTAYPRAIQLFAEGRLAFDRSRVRIRDASTSD